MQIFLDVGTVGSKIVFSWCAKMTKSCGSTISWPLVRELEISGSSGNDDMKSFSLVIHLAAVLSTLLLAYVVLFKLLMILARMLLQTNRQTIARLRATSTLKAEDANDRRRHRRMPPPPPLTWLAPSQAV